MKQRSVDFIRNTSRVAMYFMILTATLINNSFDHHPTNNWIFNRTNTQNCIWFPPTTILDFYWECKLGRLLTFTVAMPYRKDHQLLWYDRDERCSKIPRLNLLERNSSVSWGNEMRKDLQLGSKVRSLRLQSLYSKVQVKMKPFKYFPHFVR